MELKHRSHVITEGRDRAGARSMYKAIGFTDDDLAKPLIAVANTWIETMPCNFHLRRLSAKVKEGIRAAGGTPMEFNTISISDGEPWARRACAHRWSAAKSLPIPSNWFAADSSSTQPCAWSAVTRRYPRPPWLWPA